MSNPLFDALFAAGASTAPAVETERRTFTYAELKGETGRYAGALVALGVKPGDRVAAQVEKSAAGLIFYLATIRAGAVFLPLNPAYTPAELAYFLADAEPALVVVDPARRDSLAGGAAVETLDGAGEGTLATLAAGQEDRFATRARAPADLAAICYTSGTTGRSKGAMLSHRNLVANAEVLRDLWRFTDRDVLIHALPIYHVHGLFIATHVAMTAGAAMLLQPRFEPAAVIAAMGRATALMGVPTFYSRLLADPGLTREAAAGMRLFVSGSAPLLAHIHRQWTARTGHAILERYGLSETGMNASNPYAGERRAGTVGFALPGVALRLAGPAGGPAERGAVGIIEVKGPNVFSGYWRNPAATAEAFRADGFFITGDLGAMDQDGYLTIVGREKDLIITGGLNVYPVEIEAAIDAIPGVMESAVIGLPHPDLGEAVTAVVVARPGVVLTEAAIVAAIAGDLARFKHPRRVLFAAELPRNAMGKVPKAALRTRHARLYADAPLERRVKPST